MYEVFLFTYGISILQAFIPLAFQIVVAFLIKLIITTKKKTKNTNQILHTKMNFFLQNKFLVFSPNLVSLWKLFFKKLEFLFILPT